MGIKFADSVLVARSNAIKAARDAGSTGAKLRIYDGTRPAKGGTPTNLLAELTFSTVSSPSSIAGVLTASTITGEDAALRTGTATWFREVDSSGTFILDGDCGLAASSADLKFNDVAIVLGLPVNVTSYVITEGNK